MSIIVNVSGTTLGLHDGLRLQATPTASRVVWQGSDETAYRRELAARHATEFAFSPTPSKPWTATLPTGERLTGDGTATDTVLQTGPSWHHNSWSVTELPTTPAP
jgi:hypothetical protein